MSISLVIADDHKMIRDGLKALLAQESGITVVGEAGDGRAVIRVVTALKPDVVLLDIGMPELNGIGAARRILEENRQARIVILSMHSDAQTVADAFRAGARGFVLKESAYSELVTAVKAVHHGQTYVSPGAAGSFVQQRLCSRAPTTVRSAFESLSSREREVLQLFAEGGATSGIAKKLRRSVKTVETHRRHIMHKLGLYTIAELTKYAIRQGVTQVDK